MGKFFVPTIGPESWKGLLAEPEKQWRTGFSAKTLANCWEQSGGFPPSVSKVLKDSGIKKLGSMEFLLAFPEWPTSLPGGRQSSRSDILVLAKADGQLATLAVEGKVSEPFGPTVSEWQKSDSPGKRTRLAFLRQVLGLGQSPLEQIRYQLLHRTASALIEANRFNASLAIMLVHSFDRDNAWIDDYQAFLSLFDVYGAPNTITSAGIKNGVELYLSWVTGEKQYLLA